MKTLIGSAILLLGSSMISPAAIAQVYNQIYPSTLPSQLGDRSLTIQYGSVNSDRSYIYSSGYSTPAPVPPYGQPDYRNPYGNAIPNAIPGPANCPICIPPTYAVPNYSPSQPIYPNSFNQPVYLNPVPVYPYPYPVYRYPNPGSYKYYRQ